MILSIVLSDRVIIKPDTNHPFIKVALKDDGRDNNKKTATNLWRLRGSPSSYKRVNDWALSLKLSATQYGFKPHSDNSSVAITTRGFCTTKYCDTYYAFQFGDEYVMFMIDNNGYGIYPPCGGRVGKGYASVLIQKIKSISKNNREQSDAAADALKAALVGGNAADWHRFDNTEHNEAFPFKIEFINNDNEGIFTVRLITDKYPSGTDCFYYKVITGKTFMMYMTPGWNGENLIVRSFEIDGMYVYVTF